MRRHNTKKDGSAWSDEAKQKIWEKGRSIPNYSDAIWRHDKCGAVMKYSEHGNRDSEYGWEVDHINPVSNGGDDNYYNLQPLNWKNNASKGDNLNWKCQ